MSSLSDAYSAKHWGKSDFANCAQYNKKAKKKEIGTTQNIQEK
jgi:hypothetical protein